MKLLNATVLALSLLCPLLPVTAMAGFAEGDAAYKQKDYATALRELKPLADQGNTEAQTRICGMYNKSANIDVHIEADKVLKWCRLAAVNGCPEAHFSGF